MRDQGQRATIRLASQRDVKAIGVLMALLILTIAWLFIVIHQQSMALDEINSEIGINRNQANSLNNTLSDLSFTIRSILRRVEQVELKISEQNSSMQEPISELAAGIQKLNSDILLYQRTFAEDQLPDSELFEKHNSSIEKVGREVGYLSDTLDSMRGSISSMSSDVEDAKLLLEYIQGDVQSIQFKLNYPGAR